MSYLVPENGIKRYGLHTEEEIKLLTKLLDSNCMKEAILCLTASKKPITMIMWLNGTTLEVVVHLSSILNKTDISLRRHFEPEKDRKKMPDIHFSSSFTFSPLLIPQSPLNTQLYESLIRETKKECVGYLGRIFESTITEKKFSITFNTTIEDLITQIDLNFNRKLETLDRERIETTEYWKRILNK